LPACTAGISTSSATRCSPTKLEMGTNTPTLLARSRRASVRSLERYAWAGPEAVLGAVPSRYPARPGDVLTLRPHS
jgi:hypothetical protein